MTTYLNPTLGFSKMIRAIIPWRFRRMLVLSGVYGAISAMEKPLLNHAKELSEVLRLSKDPAFVEVPIAFHSVLVSKFNRLNVQVQGRVISLKDVAQRALTEEERNALSSALAEQVRPSLRYSHRSCMAHDFYDLLGFINKKHMQTA